MNWSSVCAACHNTRVRKNYDEVTDAYRTTMVEMGVSCESCHGAMKEHVRQRQTHREPKYEEAHGAAGCPPLSGRTRAAHAIRDART